MITWYRRSFLHQWGFERVKIGYGIHYHQRKYLVWVSSYLLTIAKFDDSIYISLIEVSHSFLYITIDSTIFVFIVPLKGLISLGRPTVMEAMYLRFHFSVFLILIGVIYPSFRSNNNFIILIGELFSTGVVSSLVTLLISYDLSYCVSFHPGCTQQYVHS